jgi:NAD(P)H dehydrogenase (quinone)
LLPNDFWYFHPIKIGNLCGNRVSSSPEKSGERNKPKAQVETTKRPEAQVSKASETVSSSFAGTRGARRNMAPKVLVLTYSVYGHVTQLARHVVKGVQKAGAECDLMRVPETLSEEVLKKIHAPPKPEDIPVLSDPNKLTEYDGILFGYPTRYGQSPAQISAFWDATGSLWLSGALQGKAAGIFTSTASIQGGQETTALTAITRFAHHGMIFVPLGYADPSMLDLSQVHGGSPYGASTFAGGDGSRQPSEMELRLAEIQGERFAIVVKKLAA